jgi:hypothetical protein
MNHHKLTDPVDQGQEVQRAARTLGVALWNNLAFLGPAQVALVRARGLMIDWIRASGSPGVVGPGTPSS